MVKFVSTFGDAYWDFTNVKWIYVHKLHPWSDQFTGDPPCRFLAEEFTEQRPFFMNAKSGCEFEIIDPTKPIGMTIVYTSVPHRHQTMTQGMEDPRAFFQTLIPSKV